MSLLDSLCDEKVWEEFAQYKASHGNMTKKEQHRLDEYISNKRYLPLARTLNFSLPEKGFVNKSGSDKKRVIYTFPEDETWVLKLLAWLLYRYDSAFHDSCYSFRQDMTAKTAVRDVLAVKGLDGKWVLKLDIHDYFNSIPSQRLAEELSAVITDDPKLLEALTRFFTLDKAVCGGETVSENRGAMAGVPLSAFFANIYLASLDRMFEQLNVPYFRYSDDILVLARTKDEAVEYYGLIAGHVADKGLSLNPEKYSLTAPGEPFEFLGFGYHCGETDLSASTLKKTKAKIKRKAAAIYRRKLKKGLDGDAAARAMIKTFNRKFFEVSREHELSWSRWYFPVLTSDKGLHELDRYLTQNIRFLYTGRHCKRNYRVTYEHIKSLGYKSLVNEFYKFRENKSDR